MIHTIENSRKLIFGRIGVLLLGAGLYLSVMSIGLMGVAITTLFGIDIVITLREESV